MLVLLGLFDLLLSGSGLLLVIMRLVSGIDYQIMTVLAPMLAVVWSRFGYNNQKNNCLPYCDQFMTSCCLILVAYWLSSGRNIFNCVIVGYDLVIDWFLIGCNIFIYAVCIWSLCGYYLCCDWLLFGRNIFVVSIK